MLHFLCRSFIWDLIYCLYFTVDAVIVRTGKLVECVFTGKSAKHVSGAKFVAIKSTLIVHIADIFLVQTIYCAASGRKVCVLFMFPVLLNWEKNFCFVDLL